MLPIAGGMPVKFAPIVAAIFVRHAVRCGCCSSAKRRLKKFAAQLPDALELIARALRAGHSLAAGFNLVAAGNVRPDRRGVRPRRSKSRTSASRWKKRSTNLTERIPNLDLKFFATAVILQRQTGGDLAEILDKIGHLIRERFKIWGQVQALTGEGRLARHRAAGPAAGAVRGRLPHESRLRHAAVHRRLGKKMLVGGLVMQLLGALVIRKIVNIRV